MQCIHCFSQVREIDGEYVCRSCGHVEPMIVNVAIEEQPPTEKPKRRSKKTAL